MESFLLAFIPLFVAIDPVGTIPLFISLTHGFKSTEKKKLAFQAVGTALVAGVVFGIAGHYIFKALGITSDDFKIAGGLLLLVLSFREMFGTSVKQTKVPARDELIGYVPLGIPVIAGPALITTILILKDVHSYGMIMFALGVNLLLTYLLYFYSESIFKVLGEAVSRVTAKLVAIFLAAIGIMMIRRGLESILS